MRYFLGLALLVCLPALAKADTTSNSNATLTAVSQTVTLGVEMIDKVNFQVSGTWTATLIVEASNNSSAATAVYSQLSVTAERSQEWTPSITANGTYKVDVGGYRYARIRVSSYTGGSIVIAAQTGKGGNFPVNLAPSSYVYVSRTVQLVTTSGLAVNVSHVAGTSCSGDCRIYWSTRDAVGVYWDLGNSAGAGTIPTTLGHFTATSVTATLDDGFTDGQIMYFKPTAATSVSVFVTVRKRQP